MEEVTRESDEDEMVIHSMESLKSRVYSLLDQ